MKRSSDAVTQRDLEDERVGRELRLAKEARQATSPTPSRPSLHTRFGADDTLQPLIESLVHKAILAVGDVANEATWLTRKETVELLLTTLIKQRLTDAFLKLDKRED